jgi:ABC-type glutathione transport system ATPase component
MKRYSSGLYARLGFSVAVNSDPDVVLVDEVLAVGDAAFRRRAIDSLRRLIGEGKTVLFISHDIWNVRRLCERTIWMDEGRVRAIGAAGEVADRYMEEVNVRALANRNNALHSHRSGTGEIRYTSVQIVERDGRPTGIVREGSPLVVRAGYQAASPVVRPIFQIAIVDVDTGLVVATASSDPADAPLSVEGGGEVECVFESVPLRPRQYLLRMTITDAHQLVSYDVVTGETQFVVGAARDGVGQGSDDQDGFVSLKYRFAHRLRAMS